MHFSKRLLFLALTIAAVLVTTANSFSQPCDSLPAGLVGWWQAEGNANDLVNGDNGTFYGNVAFSPGVVGQAFNLNGSSCVLLNTNAALQLQDFTIEAWVQRGSLNPANDGLIFGFGDAGYGFGLSPDGTPFITKIDVDNVKPNYAITDTSFHHVAVTKDGTTVFFYVDGVAYPAPTYNTAYTFGSTAAIGGRGDAPASTGDFIGQIDELSIYNRPLSQSEVQSIFQAGSAGKCATNFVTIVTQPASQTVVVHTNVSFSVTVSNFGPVHYQWFFAGNAISGATGSSLDLTSVTVANAGNYQVVVTNLGNSATSSVATLTVQTPPSIVIPPFDQSVYPGASAVFFVAANGDAPLAYHWFFNTNNPVGQNDYSLVIPNCQTGNSGTYYVVVSNAAGSVTSAPAVLTLFTAPVITNQPASQTNYVGGSAFFAAGTAAGSGALSYQWRFNGINLARATASLLAVNNLQFSNAGNYSVIISNPAGQAISSNAALTVLPAACDPMPSGLVGWWQGEKSTADVLSGNLGTIEETVTFVPGIVGSAFNFDGLGSAVSVGNPTNYQLQDFTIDAWVKRASAGQASLTGNSGCVLAYGSGGYGFGMLDSGQMFLTKIDFDNVMADCYVTDTYWHHIAVTKLGTNVVFYLDGVAHPAPPYSTSYDFYTGLAIGSRGDAFNSTFLGAVDEVDLFNRVLSPAEIHSLYAAANLGKCPVPPTLLSPATNQSLTIGSNITLSVNVSGTGPLIYQWFQNGALLAGATNATLTLSNFSYFQAGSYSVNVGNSLQSITISNIIVSVQPATLLVNGSFETGDFTGWVPSDISLSLYPLDVEGEGYSPGFGFFFAVPTDGEGFAIGGFEGNGPGTTSLAQDVILPAGPSLLTFDYRAAWDMLDYGGSTLPRTIDVTVQPSGGGTPLHTFTLLTAPPQTADPDTGWQHGSLNLAPYSGRALRISFDANVPESFTGPGFFELDNVVLSYSILPPLLISRANNQLVLTWPASTPNYTLQANTSLAAPNGWTTISSNLIAYGPTNSIATLTLPSHPTFYRLKSP